MYTVLRSFNHHNVFHSFCLLVLLLVTCLSVFFSHQYDRVYMSFFSVTASNDFISNVSICYIPHVYFECIYTDVNKKRRSSKMSHNLVKR